MSPRPEPIDVELPSAPPAPHRGRKVDLIPNKAPSRWKAKGAKTGRTSLLRLRLPTIIALASQGYSRREIAEHLTKKEGKEVTANAIGCALYYARKHGMLSDTEDKLTYMAAPMAADVVIDRLSEGDKAIAVETLKGLGFFKSHAVQKGDGGIGVQALQVVFQSGERSIEKKAENIVGQPKVIDVEEV